MKIIILCISVFAGVMLTGCDLVFPERKRVSIEGVVQDTLENRLEGVRVLIKANGGLFTKPYREIDTVYTDKNGIFTYSKNFKDAPFDTSVMWNPDHLYNYSKFGVDSYEVMGCRSVSPGMKCREKILIVLKDRSQVTGFLLK